MMCNLYMWTWSFWFPIGLRFQQLKKSSEIFLSSIRLLIFSRLSDNFDALKGRNDGRKDSNEKAAKFYQVQCAC